MRKRKLYLSELIKRNKNNELRLMIHLPDLMIHFESIHDIEVLKYYNCEVKHWKVIKTAIGYKLIVYL